jgi:hypothetical protein
MWGKVVLLIAVGLAAASCGLNSDLGDTAGVTREIPAPKSSGWGTVPVESVEANTGAERIVSDDAASDGAASDQGEPESSPEGVFVPTGDGICAVFLAVMLTSPDEFGSDLAANAAYRSALEPINAEAASLLDEVRSESAASDRLWELLARLDEITLAGCSVPFEPCRSRLQHRSAGWLA